MNTFSTHHLLTTRGFKKTPSRIAVLDVLQDERRPLDVGEILTFLQGRNIEINQATVYRMLDAFYKNGLIHRFEFQEGKYRYEIAGRRDHHHLICENCGQIADISDCGVGELEDEIQAKKKFLVKRHALEFYGLCQNCQQ